MYHALPYLRTLKPPLTANRTSTTILRLDDPSKLTQKHAGMIEEDLLLDSKLLQTQLLFIFNVVTLQNLSSTAPSSLRIKWP